MTNLDSILKKQRHYFANKDLSSQNYGFSSWTIKKAETEDLMFSNCDAGQDFSESLGQQADETSSSKRKSTLDIHWKD